jgi:hypothetical protein
MRRHDVGATRQLPTRMQVVFQAPLERRSGACWPLGHAPWPAGRLRMALLCFDLATHRPWRGRNRPGRRLGALL